MVKFIAVLLIGMCSMGMAQEAATSAAAPSWIIWLDGTRFVPEWSQALQAVLQVMKPGEAGMLVAPGSEYRFVRQAEDSQLDTLVNAIRPNFELGAHRFTQISNEMVNQAEEIRADESSKSLISGYLLNRKQLLDLYGESQQHFWKALNEGLVPPGARLVVLVQQFDVPAVDRSILEALRENARMREWVLDLQETAPYEEKTKNIKKLAELLKSQKIRVDGFYLSQKGSTLRGGVEVSKALFSGVTRLSKATGGVSQYLKASAEEIVAALNQ